MMTSMLHCSAAMGKPWGKRKLLFSVRCLQQDLKFRLSDNFLNSSKTFASEHSKCRSKIFKQPLRPVCGRFSDLALSLLAMPISISMPLIEKSLSLPKVQNYCLFQKLRLLCVSKMTSWKLSCHSHSSFQTDS